MKNEINSQAEMSDHNTTYEVNESVPMLMAACVKSLRQSLNARFAELGYAITSEQWILLCHLAEQDGVSQLDLARRYRSSEVSTLNLLNKLESHDLVLRQRDPIDARSKRVYLTTKGRNLQAKLIPAAKANIQAMSQGLDSDDIEQLKAILRTIYRNLSG
ncbi:DNA-binding transcriptional regulator, MarR family [Desulfuromusa kysingii]|uniref:DNA-binding transcriptional regulator, MarR family n=1 Tax=Desulfuromusa kysingii TaxID=37625 RepID=A0A1H4AZB9_9BACT|nr:winged helix DNA-binding protein [Desulfuromusa kysingii]SEA41220.1 DNA-binding transcriptional regulator, MarR family [Desulfuromusa kysingii]